MELIKCAKHGGAIGDLICALPYLISTDQKYRLYISQDFELGRKKRDLNFVQNIVLPYIKRFFQSQTVIEKVEIHQNQPIDINLDAFRETADYCRMSLHRMYFYKFGGFLRMDHPWIFNIPPKKIENRDIIISRTLRYPNDFFPHREIADLLGHRMIFIGFQDEYEQYAKFDQKQKVLFHKVTDLYEAAQLIAGSNLCISNATAILHIAQGLNTKRIFEATLNYNGVWVHGYTEGDRLITEIEAQDRNYVLEMIASILESTPVESTPIESKQIKESKPKPIESKPIESKPVESKPVESKPVESKPIELSIQSSKPKAPIDLPIHFVTIVQNGEPLIRYHINVFLKLPFRWHWHIVEGIADLKHDSAWVKEFGGNILPDIHKNGKSNDGTTEYLDQLKASYPEFVTIYRKPDNMFWDGKREMMNAPLANIKEECLLWQVDVDEFWTSDQIRQCWKMFIDHPEKNAALYWCNYFVSEDLVIENRNCYGNRQGEWLRTWRYKNGSRWDSHEPPVLVGLCSDGSWRNIAEINAFVQEETAQLGLVFQHLAYVMPKQLEFKQSYYGYKNALDCWYQLQLHHEFPVLLRNFFHWVQDDAMVNTVKSLNIKTIIKRVTNTPDWIFHIADDLIIPARYRQLDRASMCNNIALNLEAEKKYEEASNYYKRALAIDPDNCFANCNFGKLLHIHGYFDEAMAFYKTAIASNPDMAEPYNNLGSALQSKGKMKDALDCYMKSFSIKPDNVDTCANMGFIYEKLANLNKAIEWYKLALSVDAHHANAHTNLGIAYLLSGDLLPGFIEYEWRFKKSDVPKKDYSGVRWDGSDFKGKTLLIFPEQGFGDYIHFIRYAPMVKKLGGKVIAECPPELIELISKVSGIDQVVVKGSALPPFDLNVPLVNLPIIFKTTLFSTPNNIPYLTALKNPNSAIAKAIEPYRKNLCIGLAWAGNPKHKEDRLRSIPFVQLTSLLQFQNITFFSLQKVYQTLTECGVSDKKIVDLDPLIKDFSDTAQAVENLDLIISVDSAVAHLAGALGKPVWTLLAKAPDWRWMLDLEISYWYPGMRLFRQTKPEDWSGVVKQLCQELAFLNLAFQRSITSETYHQKGAQCYEKQRFEDAARFFQIAAICNPSDAAAYSNMGAAFDSMRKSKEAAFLYQRAISISPNTPDYYKNLCIALRKIGEFDLALKCCDKALSIKEDFHAIYDEKAVIFEKTLQYEKSMELYQKAYKADPNNPSVHKDMGIWYLLHGDLLRGFEEFEWRFKCQDYPKKRLLPIKRWDGISDLNGKTILICSEQGYGDIIQFIRYAPMLKQRGGTVVLGTFKPLERLLSEMQGIDRVFVDSEPLEQFDMQVSVVSLPHVMKTTLETIPAKFPYIKTPKLSEDLSLIFDQEKYKNRFKIGFVWAGAYGFQDYQFKAIELNKLEPLLEFKKPAFFSLQKGPNPNVENELKAYLSNEYAPKDNIVDLNPYLNDFADTAAVMNRLDLIITVDTAVAHLAGALGKPVWVMLPFAADWRWLKNRTDSPWYPTMRLFRQPMPNQWEPVINEICNNLKTLLRKNQNIISTTGVLSVEQANNIETPKDRLLVHSIGYMTGHTGYNIHTSNFYSELGKRLRSISTDLMFPGIFEKGLENVKKEKERLKIDPDDIINILISYGNTMDMLQKCEGKKICYTVWESTKVPDDWIEPMQKADEIWTPSHWGKNIFTLNGLESNKIKVVPEGIDPSVFNPDIKPFDDLKRIPAFKFLHVGRFEDRKFSKEMIKAFDEEFQNTRDVILILACHNPFIKDFDIRKELDKLQLKGPSKICFINPIANHSTFARYYVSCDAFIFPTRAEGWGLPIIEAMASGLPSIVTNYSGQTEYINQENAYLLDYTMEEVWLPFFFSKRNYYGHWAKPSIEHLKYLMRYVYEHREEAKTKGLYAAKDMATNWSWSKAAEKAYQLIRV